VNQSTSTRRRFDLEQLRTALETALGERIASGRVVAALEAALAMR